MNAKAQGGFRVAKSSLFQLLTGTAVDSRCGGRRACSVSIETTAIGVERRGAEAIGLAPGEEG